MLYDAVFFEKHQATLLRIANSRFTRWLLGLNRLPERLKNKKIINIKPGAIRCEATSEEIAKANRQARRDYKFGHKTFATTFYFTRFRFSEALAFNLSPFCYFQDFRERRWVWRFSPVGVLGMIVVALLPKVGFLGFVGTTTSYYAGGGDGWVVRQNNSETWAQTRNAASGTAADYTTSEENSPQIGIVAGYNTITRLFFPHYTAGILGTVIAASFHFSTAAAGTNPDGVSLVLVPASQASTSELVVSDYSAITFTDLGRKTYASVINGGNFYIDIPSGNLNLIDKNGWTKLGLSTSPDFDNSSVANLNYLYFYFSETAGTGSDPYVSVTDVVSATGPTQDNLLTLGVS